MKRSTRRIGRGSVSIELLVVLPMFASLWVLSIYAFGFHAERTANQRHVRRCAWSYALSGCQDLPGDCGDLTASGWLTDFELRAAAGGEFEKVQGTLPFLGTLSQLHGSTFSMRRIDQVNRPAAFGGSVPAEATFHVACATRTREWTTATVFQMTCRTLGVARWCP